MTVTLPPWVESVYPTQVTAIQSILQAFESGSRVVFMEAPTGSGKTLIAELVRQYLDTSGIYLCSTISLQAQYMRDFPHAALLMGRSNYPTLDRPDLFDNYRFPLTCAECVKTKVRDEYHCKWCSSVPNCPYESAKRRALASTQVCQNTYYFLSEVNHVGRFGGRGLITIDECDLLEQVLMGIVEVSFTERRLSRFHLPMPDKKTVEASWVSWANEAFDIVVRALDRLQRPSLTSTIEQVKEYNATERAVHDIARLIDPEYGIESGGWVYTGYRDGDVQFKPVRVDQFGHDYLWRHGKRFLLMSATIISSDELADSLGLNREEVGYV